MDAAFQLGVELADRGVQVVYGGGGTGLMGAVAEGALSRGGHVTGVIPRVFHTPALAHERLSTLTIVETMHERKALMISLAEGFIALPGGLGTMEELFEVLTWAQIGLHRKPIGILNTAGYFRPFLDLIDRAGQEGFLYPEHRELFVEAQAPFELLERMASFRFPSGLERWVDRGKGSS